MTAFFVILRQISPKTSRRCKKCGRILAYFVENLCCFIAKNAVEYCQKKLLSKFIEKCCNIQRFQTNFDKNLKNFVECRSILSKTCVVFQRKILMNQVEKYYQKILLSHVEKSQLKKPLLNVEKYYQNLPSKNVC